MNRVLAKIKSQKHPVRFLISRVLWYTGLGRILTIRLPSGVRIRFFPTAASASFWVDPAHSMDDGLFIGNYLAEGDTFIDVGANIGYLTLTGARKVGTTGHVISLEPHPRTFRFLNKNIRLNQLTNIQTHNVAVGDTKATLSFSDSKSDEQNFITENGPLSVGLTTLDDLFDGASVELLKIDTEGYELFVLKGASKILPKTKLIFLESFQTHFDRYNYHRKDIVDLLARSHFKVFKFVSANELREIDPRSDLGEFENLVAVGDVAFLQSRMKNLTIVRI